LLRFSDKQWLLEDEATSTIGVDFRVRSRNLPLHLFFFVIVDVGTLNPAPTPQSRSQELINVKLLFNGNSSVGKISLLLRFSAKQWLPEDVASASRDDWG
jgi:hypothetical protein